MIQFIWKESGAGVPLLHFEIKEEMGRAPLLMMTVPKKYLKAQDVGALGHLYDGSQLLFAGQYRETLSAEGDFALVVLDRVPQKDISKKGPCLLTDLVFGKDACPHAGLEFGDVLPHVDRVTGDVQMKPVEGCGKTHLIDQRFFEQSCRIERSTTRPLRLSVEAEWVQRFDGVHELGNVLRGGKITTFTPDDLAENWFDKNTSLLKTGYEILKSGVTEIEGVSPEISLDVGGKDMTLQSTLMRPSLVVGWHYRQKRVERAFLEQPGVGETEVLNLRLYNICSRVRVGMWHSGMLYGEGAYVRHAGYVWRAKKRHKAGDTFDVGFWTQKKAWPTALSKSESWTFFETKTGRAVLSGLLNWAARRTWWHKGDVMQMRVPYDAGKTMTVHDQVRLKDPRLGTHPVYGVITALSLIVEGDHGEAWADVRLRVLPKKPKPSEFDLILKEEVEGIKYPGQLTARDLVVDVRVQDDAFMQKEKLMGKKLTSGHDIDQVLETCPTRVEVRLRSLKSLPSLDHRWDVRLKH